MTVIMTDQEYHPAQGDIPGFICSVCNEPVFVFDGKVFRSCEHSDAPVLANIQAICTGDSAVS